MTSVTACSWFQLVAGFQIPSDRNSETPAYVGDPMLIGDPAFIQDPALTRSFTVSVSVGTLVNDAKITQKLR